MKKIYYYLLIILLFLISTFIRIIAFKNNSFNVCIDECHSLADIGYQSYLYLFGHYMSGANFLPGYRAVLNTIYNLFGYNYAIFKSFSLLCGILTFVFFYNVLSKIFKNKVIIISALTVFTFNYNLILYSTQIKNYELDVLIVLIILNTILNTYNKYKNEEIPISTILLCSVISIIFIYTSIPALVLIEFYWLIFFLYWLKSKNVQNIKKALLFQVITAPFLILEYFTYIIQIQKEDAVKDQWVNGNFFFRPDSVEAINSLINFSFFDFYWFDKDVQFFFTKSIIFLFLLIFLMGSFYFLNIPFKKGKDFSGLFVISPVYLFVLLSFINIYPFCNRLIVFLIPIFIIIIFKPFDVNNKLKLLNTLIVIIITSAYLYHVYSFNKLHIFLPL